MTNDLMLRRKWTLRAHGQQVIFVKKRNESSEHVLMKAFIWALYLPAYPDLLVEVSIGDRYKPDVVSLDERQRPRFWGEAGEVGKRKIESLVRRYRHTHFALAKWDASLDPFREIVQEAVENVRRTAPFDLLCFPPESPERFIDDNGRIDINHDALQWLRLYPNGR